MHIRQVHKITKICITHLPSSTNNQKLQCQNKIRLNFKVKLNRHKKTLQRYIIAAKSVTSTQNGIVKININALGIQSEDLKEYMPKHHVQCNHTTMYIHHESVLKDYSLQNYVRGGWGHPLLDNNNLLYRHHRRDCTVKPRAIHTHTLTRTYTY